MSDNIQSIIDSGGKCSYKEYQAIYDEIKKKNKPNVLIFGTGHDSKLWVEANKGGITLFVENNSKWADFAEKDGFDVVRVAYNSKKLSNKKIHSEKELAMNLPKFILETDWNVIFVDSPVGRTQGRMKSIFNAFLLATKEGKKKWTTVFVHDYNRHSEKIYVDHFFAKFEVETIHRLARIVCNK